MGTYVGMHHQYITLITVWVMSLWFFRSLYCGNLFWHLLRICLITVCVVSLCFYRSFLCENLICHSSQICLITKKKMWYKVQVISNNQQQVLKVNIIPPFQIIWTPFSSMVMSLSSPHISLSPFSLCTEGMSDSITVIVILTVLCRFNLCFVQNL